MVSLHLNRALLVVLEVMEGRVLVGEAHPVLEEPQGHSWVMEDGDGPGGQQSKDGTGPQRQPVLAISSSRSLYRLPAPEARSAQLLYR